MSKTPTQLRNEINDALSRPPGFAAKDKQPLYRHTSESTAYLVEDYPYGFTVRTAIRYWLEHKPKKGWRLVSQTKNPKTGAWNKPKASTYTDWGGAMYLDGQDHVQWTGVGPYTNDAQMLAFVTTFPDADLHELRKVVPAKLRHLEGLLSGKIFFTVNGVPQPRSEADIARNQRALEIWKEIGGLLA